jgi:hypothetical protein
VTEVPLQTVGALIDKSLLDRRTAADASTRLMMLDTVRAYALERLAEDPIGTRLADGISCTSSGSRRTLRRNSGELGKTKP